MKITLAKNDDGTVSLWLGDQPQKYDGRYYLTSVVKSLQLNTSPAFPDWYKNLTEKDASNLDNGECYSWEITTPIKPKRKFTYVCYYKDGRYAILNPEGTIIAESQYENHAKEIVETLNAINQLT